MSLPRIVSISTLNCQFRHYRHSYRWWQYRQRAFPSTSSSTSAWARCVISRPAISPHRRPVVVGRRRDRARIASRVVVRRYYSPSVRTGRMARPPGRSALCRHRRSSGRRPIADRTTYICRARIDRTRTLRAPPGRTLVSAEAVET